MFFKKQVEKVEKVLEDSHIAIKDTNYKAQNLIFLAGIAGVTFIVVNAVSIAVGLKTIRLLGKADILNNIVIRKIK